MRRLALSILLVAVAACSGGKTTTTDTGYEGTWVRGGELVTSTISIVKVDGVYKYRVGLVSEDGKRIIRCDWEGVCEEFIDGEKTSDYKYTTRFNEESKTLEVECVGSVHRPTVASIHDIDELVVKRNGLKLRRRAILRGDKSYRKGDYPRPLADYTKLSDQVVDPPPGWHQPGN